jgi:hypothetical protein
MITAMFTIGFAIVGAATAGMAGNAIGSKCQNTKTGQSTSNVFEKTSKHIKFVG